MTIILQQDICADAKVSHGRKTIYKTYPSGIKPNVGDYVEGDSLWDSSKEYAVKAVLICFEDKSCTVVLDDLEVSNVKEMFNTALKHHGWIDALGLQKQLK